mgnify:FL=1
MQQLEKLLAAEPDDAFTLYAMAMELAKQGKHAEAMEFFDRCIASDPHYCYAYFHKARSQESAGDVEGARATLEAGLVASREAGDAKAIEETAGYLRTLG